VQRNPIIAEVFYRTGLIEKWGRGTNRVAEMCTAAGIAPPEFAEITGAAVVTFRVRRSQDRLRAHPLPDRGRPNAHRVPLRGGPMSEYQCYEFVALDRPLTAKQMAELRAISTRAPASTAALAHLSGRMLGTTTDSSRRVR
jgi:predicted HTH transcriptional regulator